MVFSSHVFLFYYLPITLIVYYTLLKCKVNISWINLFITIVSYIFYGWFEPWFVTLMWASSIIDYICGRVISRPSATRFSRNAALLVSVTGNLGLLGFFKYYMFAMNGINRLIELFGAQSNSFHILNIMLPIGISFYTFQTMSYTIDVWRGDAPPVKDFRTFSCFVALFPQLIAGPIIRYNSVAEQLSEREHTLPKFTSGAALFIAGFAKKTILANAAGEIADAVFGADAPGPLTAWWGALAYSFQIYFDFCGYSDMAVGLGRMIGFEFIKNFDAPYHADSISSFWNRWHISLSTWIRDYLYISIGGNRKGAARTYVNLGIAMFLCGFWHGAQWTFIAWGTFHACLLIWERAMGRKAVYHAAPLLVRVVVTNILIVVGWVIFRAPSIDQVFHYWGSMFGVIQPAVSASLLAAEMFSVRNVTIMGLCGIFVWQPAQAFEWVHTITPLKALALFAVFLFAIGTMFNQTFNPFLYFQF